MAEGSPRISFACGPSPQTEKFGSAERTASGLLRMYSENPTEVFHSPAMADVCSGSNTSLRANDSENVGTNSVPSCPITSLIAFNSNSQSSTSARELSIARKAASATWR